MALPQQVGFMVEQFPQVGPGGNPDRVHRHGHLKVDLDPGVEALELVAQARHPVQQVIHVGRGERRGGGPLKAARNHWEGTKTCVILATEKFPRGIAPTHRRP